MKRAWPVAIALLAFSCGGGGNAASEQAKREADFKQLLSNSTLVGYFTSRNASKLSEDRYDIAGVTKLAGDLWTVNARIRHGDTDITVPVPVKVVWASDTPVITLTDATIPGVGTFTARVLFYRGEYAGTWSGGKHGGQMFGRIEKQKQ